MADNRILLIEPPFYRLHKSTYSLDRYPLSLAYIGAVIKKYSDWDVKIYNADFTANNEIIKVSYLTSQGFENYKRNLANIDMPIWLEIADVIREYHPQIIGITVKSQNLFSALNIIRIAESIDNDIRIIVGGPYPSMIEESIMKYSRIDIAVIGEGERTIIELLNAFENNDIALSQIKGIVYRNGEEIVKNPRRELIDDLDSLPFPHEYAQSILIDFEKYPKTAFRNIFAIRGCPFSCLFCGSHKIWTRKVRFRSVKSVIEEIGSLMSNFGLKAINFDDDTFGVNSEYIETLVTAIKNHFPDLKWTCELHVNLVNDKNINIMKSAGCNCIFIGVESGNNKILKSVNKAITIEDAYKACKIIRKYKIQVNAFFIIGFPEETEQTIMDTYKAIKNIKCDTVSFSIFTPYEGTQLFNICRDKGLIKNNNIVYYHHQSPENYFCENINKDRFNYYVKKFEGMVDRKNKLSTVKRLFSPWILFKLKEIGLRKGITKLTKLLKRY
jgi:anaerobic magnesium-protoporphyrin IX monomethyl ester cyclase